jgi:hypothetical protein
MTLQSCHSVSVVILLDTKYLSCCWSRSMKLEKN